MTERALKSARRLTSHEIQREGRRTFRRMSESRAFLEQREGAGKRRWGVFVPKNGFAKPVVVVSDEFVRAFLCNSWLEKDGKGRLVLSAEGRSWYARMSCGPAAVPRQQQALQRRIATMADGTQRTVTVNQAESALGWLRSRRDANGQPLLTDAQFDAGERFRADFEKAQLMPRVTADWTMPLGGKSRRRARGPRDQAISHTAIAAKQRVFSALKSVGPDLSGIVIEICCNLNGLEQSERLLGIPQRSGKLLLQIALNQLARHYGILREENEYSAHPHLRHWGAPDYRPSLDG